MQRIASSEQRAANSRTRRPPDRRNLLAGIHATATQLGMTDADRYDLQLKLTGVTSCRDMDLAQLQRVDRELRRLLRVLDATPRQARGRRTQRDERRPAEPPTKEQMDLIAHLAQDVRLTLAGYRSLCTRTLHHSWPQTREEANKITECLKAMQKRGWHPTKEAT